MRESVNTRIENNLFDASRKPVAFGGITTITSSVLIDFTTVNTARAPEVSGMQFRVSLSGTGATATLRPDGDSNNEQVINTGDDVTVNIDFERRGWQYKLQPGSGDATLIITPLLEFVNIARD